jgi:hypothetical protein
MKAVKKVQVRRKILQKLKKAAERRVNHRAQRVKYGNWERTKTQWYRISVIMCLNIPNKVKVITTGVT